LAASRSGAESRQRGTHQHQFQLQLVLADVPRPPLRRME
jgi:hypothetical protein